MDTLILKRFRNVKPKTANSDVRVYEVNGRTIQVTTSEVNGRPVVLYLDVPVGAPTDVVDLSKVTLGT
jgi:hypothetical protein